MKEQTLVALCLAAMAVIVVGVLDSVLYMRTEPPPPSGVFGLPTWSVIAAIIGVGLIGLCLLVWAPARRWLIAVPLVVLVVGATSFATKQSLANLGPDPCYQLNSVNVGELQSFDATDGSSDDGPEWINILTDGVTDPAPADRLAIVRAVDMSEASAGRLVSSLPASLQPTVRRLVAIAGSSTATAAVRSNEATRADVRELSDYAFRACGDAG